MIASSQISTEISHTTSKNERDKNSFTIFTAHDVKPQTRGSLVQHDIPWLSVKIPLQINHILKPNFLTMQLQLCKGGVSSVCILTKSSISVYVDGLENLHKNCESALKNKKCDVFMWKIVRTMFFLKNASLQEEQQTTPLS